MNTSKFSEFLAARLKLAAGDVPTPSEWSGTGNTIGALALRLGVLSLHQIDSILQRQQSVPKLFGEIGVELGYLTSQSVERLIELQRLHLDLEQGELLVVAGKLDVPGLIAALGAYRAG